MPDGIRTAPRKGRELSGPVLSFAIKEELETLRREPEWLSGSRNAVTIVKTSNLSIVLTIVKRGATLCGHKVEGPITLQVLSGVAKFEVDGQPRTLEAGTVIALEKSVPHGVEALEDCELLLTIVKQVK